MNITFFETEEWEEKRIKEFIKKSSVLKKHRIRFYREKINSDIIGLAKNCEIISTFIYSKISKDVLKELKNLKFIATRSTGFDHIDVEECKKNNVLVSNVPSYGSVTVAEHTFALILAYSRKIVQSVERTKRGDFSIQNLRGFDLQGKTIGVIGTGRIGKEVIRIANGFGMNILAYDKFKDLNYAKKMNFKYVSLNQLLGSSDIITLHLPYSKDTHHIINEKNIEKVKKGALLVNTARGALIETRALAKALTNKILGGVCLDVLEEETIIKEEHELLSHEFTQKQLATALQNLFLLAKDNVIITPHNAFNSEEAVNKIIETTLENIECFIKKKPQNLVNQS
ncbi:MAG: NAD(P)-dependent oxidoreductase [Candidatus Woesearchaeota archaeon]